MDSRRCDVCQVEKRTPFAKIYPSSIGYAWACGPCFVRHSTYSTDPEKNRARFIWDVTGRFPTAALPSIHTNPPGGKSMIHNDDVQIDARQLKHGDILTSGVVGKDGELLSGPFTVYSDARWVTTSGGSWIVDIEGAPTQWFAEGSEVWIEPRR